MSPRLSVVKAFKASATSYFPANGVYSMSNKCSDSSIWKQWNSRLRIALFAIFLVVFLLVLIQWLVVRARSVKAKWMLFGSFATATILMISYLVLAIAGDIMFDCLKIDSLGYTYFYIAVDVTQSLANFLLLFLMLVPLTLTLLRHNCFKASVPKIANALFLAVLFIFCVLDVAIICSNDVNLQTSGDFGTYIDAAVPIAAAHATLYLVGAIMAVGYVIVSLKTMLKYPTEFNGHLKWTMPALAFSLLAFATVDFIEVFGWDVSDATWTTTTEITFLVLNLVTQAATYELLLVVAGDKSFMDDDDRTGCGELARGASVTEPLHAEGPPRYQYV